MTATTRPRGWKHKLRIADLWNDEAMPFTEKRDAIVARIKRLPLYDPEGGGQEELWWIVDELGDVENEDDFDVVWSAFYDWADAERVWVEIWQSHSGSEVPS